MRETSGSSAADAATQQADPVEVTFNGISRAYEAFEEFAPVLRRSNLEPLFELWISAPGGQAMSMLRHGDNAWLMHLRFEGDRGSVTQGAHHGDETCAYTLANGQVDEYPLSRCIPIEQCYEAIAHFFRNAGARYNLVTWRDS